MEDCKLGLFSYLPGVELMSDFFALLPVLLLQPLPPPPPAVAATFRVHLADPADQGEIRI